MSAPDAPSKSGGTPPPQVQPPSGLGQEKEEGQEQGGSVLVVGHDVGGLSHSAGRLPGVPGGDQARRRDAPDMMTYLYYLPGDAGEGLARRRVPPV